jgi:hypothetical protein
MILEGKCDLSKQAAPVYIQATISIVADLAILLLPISTIAQSMMPMRLKVGVIFTFGLGLL